MLILIQSGRFPFLISTLQETFLFCRTLQYVFLKKFQKVKCHIFGFYGGESQRQGLYILQLSFPSQLAEHFCTIAFGFLYHSLIKHLFNYCIFICIWHIPVQQLQVSIFRGDQPVNNQQSSEAEDDQLES